MLVAPSSNRPEIIHLDREGRLSDFAQDVHAGLSAQPRTLPCRYFYDAEGSQLFEAICGLPEYYLTRTERSILEQRADEILSALPESVEIVELGSGSSAKTRLLLEASLRRRRELRYVTIDISASALSESSEALLRDYPRLEVVAIAAEYTQGLRWLEERDSGPKLILWLGSNVGNFNRDEATAFLRRVRETMAPEDRLLMGADLRKSRALLEPAYDDAQGVTARFNLNVLRRINRELGGRFDLSRWRHRARWIDEAGRVEMHLVSLEEQDVYIELLDETFTFRHGESIWTESSHKYSLGELQSLATAAGLQIRRQWLDAREWFSLSLLEPG